ncbi:MalY/PatB family protein [Paracoccus seriniphilus]|uniref:cysteine-S-conjugate beta-lyase n=1 Tax=Paracoccus seriniphilus TaxID=184748 RepID=A0A239PTA2_9RHOB|nr:MalY/PatB family protein [Paracoccus seriniphilus]WCR14354.1 pyridoxal phosphate-dependent aminotransferase [Paracoccus seriniphilus]SNT72937.1 cystathione beta-lyase [Paracoccus seriniphilus]
MSNPDFDQKIDRVGTRCAKWDDMEAAYGVSGADGGLAMWIADMDFRPPAAVQRAVEATAAHGIYGYPGAHQPYLDAIQWWMKNRHGWDIETGWILTTAGLVNAVAMALNAYTKQGDGVIVMSPVYHAFGRVIRAGGRELVELPLAQQDDGYVMDWSRWEMMLTGNERLMILCSPHNPGGRVWTEEELRQVADFCTRHDLILVSDDIHCDLVYPGHKHHMIADLVPDISDRLVTLTAATKTFNIAGAHIGNVIIANDDLRQRFKGALMAAAISPGLFGMDMVTAAYSPEGAEWVDALMAYLDENRRLFDDGINAIPGLRSMPLQATYLSWVDFSGTGMSRAEFTARVEQGARIAANHGPTFGQGGNDFLRFNIATPRSNVVEAVTRLQAAFADLQ